MLGEDKDLSELKEMQKITGLIKTSEENNPKKLREEIK